MVGTSARSVKATIHGHILLRAFIYGLFNDAVCNTDYTAWYYREVSKKINWKGCKRKQSWIDSVVD
jgi:hypothetical protein